ncbi:MAG: DUF3800 domain-containing protein [Desulfobulbaceae bacterium]|nr:DUF3800 domain-containing protein [Desulfobulbaceae bacterium]
MTDAQLCEMNIYCDESRHTSDPSDAFMVIGAISCPREQKREIVHQIHCLKRKFNTQGEFGWKRLSPNRRDFYWSLIDLFKQIDSLAFRCIVVDRNELDHGKYNMGDEELGFYKLYYQMLVHWLKPECAYHIYMDWQQNKTQGRFSDLKFFLQRKLSGRAKVACLEPVTSKNQPLIELTDLFIGAVGYAWNDRQSSQTKVEFCNELAKAVGFTRLKVATWRDVEKFNIFHFQGR